MKAGQQVEATAVEIEDFGVFFEREGARILVLIDDLTGDVVAHPRDCVGVGEVRRVQLVRYDERTGVFSGALLSSGENAS